MMQFSRLVALFGVIVLIATLTGCDDGTDSGSNTSSRHSTDHDHDHAHDGDGDDHDHDHAHDGDGDDHDHDHAHDGDGDDHDHDHAHHGDGDDHDHGAHDHGEAQELGSISIGGASLDVSMSGELVPNEEIHVDIVHTGGPLPAAVRLWVGVSSAAGSLKSKADGHDNHFHGHAEVPSQVPVGAALWIEVETASGARESGSLPLP